MPKQGNVKLFWGMALQALAMALVLIANLPNQGVYLLVVILYIADTNNHRICWVDCATMTVKTLEISGLCPPHVYLLPYRSFRAKHSGMKFAVKLTSLHGKN